MNKNEIIEKVYRDPSGFGSNAATLEDARRYDKTITLQDIKEWKSKNVERKKNLKSFNSFMDEKPSGISDGFVFPT